ncbi:hypothetical protein PF005_g5138 [Phytophthora fragariae]|uniref:Secreted protein n=1 Tax=Phytophthora fragariae TaxID=53985 RepID=A0A6A3E7Z4_9STRA|nr:hypothetical protein PF003_g9667 [Phytophthora fragariae]KAE8928406.1 hypothetical protein PF009_g21451 [Phytophthora fragariae]KAE9021859.1 hypothetical protein PF011_g4750 [Phytophthora fragariae]KAE9127278.1 hypothetical protein PF010_g4981 [Phytophthora fragariae]KAE9129144.1 hypothetical protein PF007_g5026 [Phytophthora fragariae]
MYVRAVLSPLLILDGMRALQMQLCPSTSGFKLSVHRTVGVSCTSMLSTTKSSVDGPPQSSKRGIPGV